MLYLTSALALSLSPGPQHGRALSNVAILNYNTGSQVTDHASMRLAMRATLKHTMRDKIRSCCTPSAYEHHAPFAHCATIAHVTPRCTRVYRH